MLMFLIKWLACLLVFGGPILLLELVMPPFAAGAVVGLLSIVGGLFLDAKFGQEP